MVIIVLGISCIKDICNSNVYNKIQDFFFSAIVLEKIATFGRWFGIRYCPLRKINRFFIVVDNLKDF